MSEKKRYRVTEFGKTRIVRSEGRVDYLPRDAEGYALRHGHSHVLGKDCPCVPITIPGFGETAIVHRWEW